MLYFFEPHRVKNSGGTALTTEAYRYMKVLLVRDRKIHVCPKLESRPNLATSTVHYALCWSCVQSIDVKFQTTSLCEPNNRSAVELNNRLKLPALAGFAVFTVCSVFRAIKSIFLVHPFLLDRAMHVGILLGVQVGFLIRVVFLFETMHLHWFALVAVSNDNIASLVVQ